NLTALVAIADYAKDNGKWAYPSPSTMAWKTRLSRRAGELIIRKLVDDGEVQPEWDPVQHRLYLHIRCICDWEAYQQEGPIPEREKISRSVSAEFALRMVARAAALREKISQNRAHDSSIPSEESGGQCENLGTLGEKSTGQNRGSPSLDEASCSQ